MAAAAPILDANPFSGTTGPNQVSRLVRLLNAADDSIKARYIELVREARGLTTLNRIATLLETGRTEEALGLMDQFGESLYVPIEQAYLEAGRSTAQYLRRQTNTLTDFNSLNARGVANLGRERARLIRELTAQQRAATLEALQDGVRRGLRPDQMARSFRDSIGLTRHQQRAVNSYRRALEELDTNALGRTLRDRRFDRTVRRAIAEGSPLSQKQINRMTDRYQQRMVQMRANTIARTEGLRATHMGDDEAWRQAVENGVVAAEDIGNRWVTASDERVRGSHSFMHEQTRAFGELFLSGNGNRLRYPGDPSASGSDTINCRCVLSRTIPTTR
jgi:hypothetical protein